MPQRASLLLRFKLQRRLSLNLHLNGLGRLPLCSLLLNRAFASRSLGQCLNLLLACLELRDHFRRSLTVLLLEGSRTCLNLAFTCLAAITCLNADFICSWWLLVILLLLYYHEFAGSVALACTAFILLNRPFLSCRHYVLVRALVMFHSTWILISCCSIVHVMAVGRYLFGRLSCNKQTLGHHWLLSDEGW